MKTLIVFFALLVAEFVYAGCGPQLSGIPATSTSEDSLNLLQPWQPCPGCRELNKFTQDYANDAWNYIRFGDGKTVYNTYFGTLGLPGPTSKMTVRTCNSLGQCAATLVTTKFNVVGPNVWGISVTKRTSIDSWTLTTAKPDGTSHTTVHLPEIVKTTPQSVPATPTDDGYTAGVDCLNNNGTPRSGTSGSGGSGGTSGEPEPTAPRDDRDCGISYIDDGGRREERRTCT
jgi:hypothetical protein